MIRNTQELLQAVQAWLNMARQDLQNRVNTFMNTQNVSVEELSNVLQISPDEINAILAGDTNISLETFAKLLIANGLAIAITPVSETPIGSYRGNRHGVDRRGQMPMTPQFGIPPYGGPQPMMPMGGPQPMGAPMFGGAPAQDPNFEPRAIQNPEHSGNVQGQPVRDSRGRFAKRPVAGTPQNNPYMTLSVDALKDIITRNNWHYEINLDTATRDDMIALLKEKETAAIGGGTPKANNNEHSTKGSTNELANALAKALASSPDLLNKLADALKA